MNSRMTRLGLFLWCQLFWGVWSPARTEPVAASKAAPDAPLFSFAHMTDSHLHDDAWIQKQKEGGRDNPVTEIVFPFPERFRLKPPSTPAAFKVSPLPESSARILEEWFGPDWIYAPGLALPPSWKDDAILLEAKKPKRALTRLYEGRSQIEKDAQGREWYEPGYQPDTKWTDCTVPNEHWVAKDPRPAGQRCFRVTFHVDRADIDRARRFALKALYYKNPAAYLNGRPLRLVGGYLHANYWNGMDVIPADGLVPGENVLAFAVQTSGWGGHKLDFDLSLQAK